MSLDLEAAVTTERLASIEAALREFDLQRFPHGLNVTLAGSDLRIQVQTDPRYGAFVARSSPRAVLGRTLPVASVEDVLQGKIWAATDDTRRPGKRQEDLADIARLVEADPSLRDHVPQSMLERLVR